MSKRWEYQELGSIGRDDDAYERNWTNEVFDDPEVRERIAELIVRAALGECSPKRSN